MTKDFPIDTQNLCILYVEDDEIIMEQAKLSLEKIFKKVYTACDGEAGFNIFKNNQSNIDVIITDIKMPKVDGIQMCLQIRELNKDIPVLITSAYSDREYLMDSIEIGVNSYIKKPFNLFDLVEKIKEAYAPIHQAICLEESNSKIQNQYNLIKGILDAQTSFTLLTDGRKLKLANKTMLNFFGYETLEEFHKEYDCICDFFIEEEGYLQKELLGKNWFDIVLEDLTIVQKVKVKDTNDSEYIFYISTKGIEFDNEHHFVVVFTDVTEMERLNKDKIKNEKQLAEHIKMAQMGSMIGNIAHQWRQPLNNISTIASGVQTEQEYGILEPTDIYNYMQNIIDSTKYLSETITTFRNFLKEKKIYREVIVQDRVDIAIGIVGVTLKEHGIVLKKDIDYAKPIKIKIVTGELVEVIINIINNAKDILLENKVVEPWVEISLIENDNKVVIAIEDNGGGISDEILPKIFNEYFTTKDEDTGTGLGLHMSKQIIENSLNGMLYVNNTNNGAKFFIELPLS